MAMRGSAVVPTYGALSSWESWARGRLGMSRFLRWRQRILTGFSSEVYKARSKRDGSIFALKKILMHNEKDGVRTLRSGCGIG